MNWQSVQMLLTVNFNPHLFTIDLNVSDVVLKYGGNVHLRELVFAENYEKTGLPTCSIPNNHQLFADGCHLELQHNIRVKNHAMGYYTEYNTGNIKEHN